MFQPDAISSRERASRRAAKNGGQRTLFLAFFSVYPPTGGASQVSYQLARHWPGRRMLAQIGDRAGVSEIESGLTITTLGIRGKGERWAKLLSVPRWRRAMCAIASEFDPDTIVLEGASWCVYHWWLIGGLRRAAPAAQILYHAHNVEYDLRRQKHGWALAWLTRWAEKAVLRQADAATAVSKVDADRFCALYGRKPLRLPNGVDLTWLHDASPKAVDAVRRRYGLPQATVLFMGGYAYFPNREAIDFLVREVFPEVVRRAPSAKLLVLGGEVPYSAPWLVAPGVVPAAELPAFIHAAAASVAPIFSGSGTRLKVIESLAAGVPVVATEKGVEGLLLQPGKDFVRAETANEFIDVLAVRLVGGEAASAALSGDAVIRFSWPTIIAQIRANIQM
jgi:O-antigen biosynthesis protein